MNSPNSISKLVIFLILLMWITIISSSIASANTSQVTLLNQLTSTSSSVTRASNSFSPTNNSLLVVSASSATSQGGTVLKFSNITDTCVGTSPWSFVTEDQVSGYEGFIVLGWAQLGSSPGTCIVRVSGSEVSSRWIIHVMEVKGHNTSVPVVQTKTAKNTSGKNLTIMFDNNPITESLIIGGVSVREHSGEQVIISPDFGYTTVAASNVSGATQNQNNQNTQYKNGSANRSLLWDWTGGENNNIAAAIEISSENGSTPPTPAPTADIKANNSNGPITINSTDSVNISWTSTNANSCNVSPSGWTGLNGTMPSGLLNESQTYTLQCSGVGGVSSDSVIVNVRQVVIALMDLGLQKYLDMFEGGLYENGTNTIPIDHAQAAQLATEQIQPRDKNGSVNQSGKIVAVSVGMSTTQDIWWGRGTNQLKNYTFVGRALNDSEVNNATLVFINGAKSGQTSQYWNLNTSAGVGNFNSVDNTLNQKGLGPKQVQVVTSLPIVRHPIGGPTLPNANASAYAQVVDLGNMARSMRTRWPNVKLWFLAGYMYGGYDTSNVVTEPYGYETGFATKWVVQAQINQMRTGVIDPLAGDLSPSVAPILIPEPYFWANGLTPRSDGLTWLSSDYTDGKHPSVSGSTKVVDLMMNYFKASPFSQCWFLQGRTCVPS